MADILERPIHFDPILSASPAFCQTDYGNDQTWEVCLDSKYPSGIALETSYGLRAKVAQVFPVFLDAKNLPIRDPNPKYTLQKLCSNLVQYQISLFPDMDVRLTLCVPDSHTLEGEVEIFSKNSSEKRIHGGVLMRLGPIESGQVMSGQRIQNQTYLSGESGGIHPVLLTGGLSTLIHRPHPGLALPIVVPANRTVAFRWVLCTEDSERGSLEKAQFWLNQPWAGRIHRIETAQYNRIISIKTGLPEWDEVFLLAQIQSQRYLMSHTNQLPFDTAISSRQSDQGFSPKKDGSDYSSDWHGLSAWELYHSLHQFYLPVFAEEAVGMFHNFIQVQQGFGEIDLRPGLGGQRSRLLAPPIMATCCRDIFRITKNSKRLAEAYPILNYFFTRWLDADHDRNQDHFPEWEHPIQTGWETNPLIDGWQEFSKGYASDTIESPALGALIYRESLALKQIANILHKTEDARRFEETGNLIKEAVENTWDKRRKLYRYQDRDTHQTPAGGTITRGVASGTFTIGRSFESPARLCLTINSQLENTRPMTVQWIGLAANGEHVIEQINTQQIVWKGKRAILTSRHTFSSIEAISLTGLNNKDEWVLSETDLSQIDITLLLPLWAGIPTQEMANRIVAQNIIPNWIDPNPYGLPLINTGGTKTKIWEDTQKISLPLFCMVAEGLIDYGFIEEATKLVNGVMEAIINVIQLTGHFSEYYHSLNGNGIGRLNHLIGLPPVGLFLKSIGVEIISPEEITVSGKNLYHRDIEIHYQGMDLIRSEKELEVTFRDGQHVRIEGPEKRTIQWRAAGGTE
jgi:hypothetical protein